MTQDERRALLDEFFGRAAEIIAGGGEIARAEERQRHEYFKVCRATELAELNAEREANRQYRTTALEHAAEELRILKNIETLLTILVRRAGRPS